jgi:hypothetical protein
MDKKENRQNESKLSEELEEFIERKKTENSALKKIYDSLQQSKKQHIDKKKK